MFSALSASSRQDVSTVLGLHSLPETVHFASLPLLGLIRHLHNRKSSLYLQIKFDLNLLFHYTRILCFCQTNCDFISKIVPPARFSSEKDSKITAEQAFPRDLQGAPYGFGKCCASAAPAGAREEIREIRANFRKGPLQAGVSVLK